MSNIIQKFYSDKVYGINSLRRRKIDSLVTSFFSEKKITILDVGCTTGYVSRPFKDIGHYVVGVDISEKSILEAKNVLDEAHVVDVEQYPWPHDVTKRKYDLIMLTEVFEHLFDQKALLRQFQKMLVPGGYVLITTPNFLVWSDRIKMMLGFYENKDMGHIHMVSYRSFKSIVESEGFSIVATNHVMKPNWLDRFRSFVSANFFAYQIVALLKSDQ